MREAVASELSRMIAQTVQDVLQAVLDPSRRIHPDDDCDSAWADEYDDRPAPAPQHSPWIHEHPWYDWFVKVGRLLLGTVTRPVPPWWPVVVLAGAGLAAVSQEPLVLTALEAVQTTTELLAR